MEEALLNVNNALSQVPGYPENVDQPSIRAEAFSSNAFMYFRLMPESGAFTEEEIVALRDWAEEYVQTADGAGAGGLQRRHARRRRAAAAGMWIRCAGGARHSLTELRDAIRARNRDVSGGDLDSGKRRYLLRTIGRFDSPEELERPGHRRARRRLHSAARRRPRELGYAEVRSYAYSEGKPILAFAVSRQIGSNVIEIKRDMLATVAELNRDVLAPRA
jgi:multidrug efflux pump subunit AcrB